MKGTWLFLIIGAALWGQSSPTTAPTVQHFTPKVRDLHRIGTPVFSFDSARCDDRGYVFFNISGYYSINAILRVKGDGGEPTVIKFPASPSGRASWHVYVDSSGTIYLLLTTVSSQTLIHLSSSGDELSRMDLSLPKLLHVHSFAVQPDGRSLFLGSTEKVDPASNPDPHKPPVVTDIPSLIWLDTTGRVAREAPFGKEFSRATTQQDGLVAAGKQEFFTWPQART